MNKLESDIRKEIKEFLYVSGYYVFPVWQGRFSMAGISDLIAIKSGIVFFIELKSASGKQKPDQIKFQNEIESHGGNYLLARSLDELIVKIANRR